MFSVLPLNKVRDEDHLIYGQSLVNLAKLNRLNFPIPAGLVVLPPEVELKKVARKFNVEDPQLFHQSLISLKRQARQIAVPELLVVELEYQQIDAQKLWQSLISSWVDELNSKIWRLGFEVGLKESLSAQPVIFTGPIMTTGQAYHDQVLDEVLITIDKGGLSVDQEATIETLVRSANQKLFLPQVYNWIIEKPSQDLKIVKLSPYTDNLEKAPAVYKSSTRMKLAESAKLATVYKVYVDLSEHLTVNPLIDGQFISGDKISDFDQLVSKLVETGKNQLKSLPLVFKLSAQPALLSVQLEAYLFCRQKHDLANLELVIPAVRSTNQLAEIKRVLATKGVNHDSHHRLWLEITTPENLLNIEEYLASGLNGILLNLTQLATQIGSEDPRVILQMIEPVLKLCHQATIPALTYGSLGWQSDFLQFMIEHGGFGVVADLPNSYFLPEYISFLEKRLVKKAD